MARPADNTNPDRDTGPDRLLRLREVAERLDLSLSSVRRLIQRGQLPAVKLNAAVRVRESAVRKPMLGIVQ